MPNKSSNVLVENCIFNYSGSSIDQECGREAVECGPLIAIMLSLNKTTL